MPFKGQYDGSIDPQTIAAVVGLAAVALLARRQERADQHQIQESLSTVHRLTELASLAVPALRPVVSMLEITRQTIRHLR